jgi:hypothetical protein
MYSNAATYCDLLAGHHRAKIHLCVRHKKGIQKNMYFSLTMTCYKVETCCINKIHKRLFVSTVIYVTTKQGGGLG